MHEGRLNYRLVLLSVISGILVGIVVSLFRVAIPFLMGLVTWLLNWGQASIGHSFLFILALGLIGCFVAWTAQREPMIGGSGIPQIAGKLSGQLNFSWPSVLFYKITGGLLAIGSGLTLGREGPSVQIGAAIGQGVAEVTKSSKESTKYLIVGAAGAGLSTAFNAPVSGIIFCLEELLKKVTRRGFLSATLTIITATLVSIALIGNDAVMTIPRALRVEMATYPYLLILGVLLGLSGVLFNTVILWSKAIYRHWQLASFWKMVFPFLITAVVLLFDARLIGSGEQLILLPFLDNPSVLTLVYLFVSKILLLGVAFGSGIPGGIFFPLLSLGALVGNIYASGLHALGLVDAYTIMVFTVIAMAAHFAAIVRAPLTGIFLILEMTGGSIQYLLPIAIVTFIAYFVAEICQSKPVYESLLGLMVND
ncbi:ClC family H(+)/Cl(-) exchange transporter [Aerococcus urinaeequi]|uniref:ClC family H(+)/Cl(-) exchange transporter n=2 Tax=Aerococcus viridans TaxID=1377 RepID=A0A2N6UFJ5_9LACT|nr:ClC family H(+)/Cl(-) exchange transporter [Aerococcus sp. HMSC10H05]OFU50144.1 ClC family H(+)/Cl(-) exchange transporter [Aerococcus sp. HMSC10H05]PMC80305.1 ClC family H(+)/Cl(-) exchange transporter [Aerococcus viridans]